MEVMLDLISNNQLQVYCINNELTKDAFVLLSYFHSKFFPYNIKNSTIYSDMPIFFNVKTQLSDAMQSLVNAGFIEIIDNKTEYEITWHHSKIREMFDSVESVIVKKTRAKAKKEIVIDESATIIFNHYKTLRNLKQQSRMTDFLKNNIDKALETYSMEDIIEALTYANSVEWLANSIDKIWNNAGWVIGRIGDFMEGGKYRVAQRKDSVSEKIGTYHGNDIILTL